MALFLLQLLDMTIVRLRIGALALAMVACGAPTVGSPPGVGNQDDPPSTTDTHPDASAAPPDQSVRPVAPGDTPPAPDMLKAFVGGTNIALRWSERGSPGVAEHKIYRDGNVVGSVTPGFHTDFPELNGNGYIDKAVTPGTTYKYQVQALGTTGGASELSAPLSVTHPTSTAQPPNIITDASGAPDLKDWLENTVKPLVQTWYPKMVVLLARPEYTPASTITLKLDADSIAYTRGPEAISGEEPKWVRENQQDALGAWVHETTHIIQNNGPNVPGWIAEGIPDWARDGVMHNRDLIPGRPGKELNYRGQYYLSWMQDTYNKGLIHAVNVSAHTGYNAGIFQQLTGKTIDQMVQAHAATRFRTGAVRLAGNKCLDGDLTANRAQAVACKDGATTQKFTSVLSDYGWVFLVTPTDGCIDVSGGNKAKGAHVQTYSCSDGGAQRWIVTADKKLMQPQAQRCLAIATDGLALELQDCDDPAAPVVTMP